MRFYLVTLLTIFSVGIFAQIPNGGFEVWADSGAYLVPEGWRSSTENYIALGGITVEQDSSAYTGAYAAKIQSVSVGNPASVYAGLLTNGSLDNLSKNGDAINYKPLKISGYYKYNTATNDSGFVYLYMNRFNAVLNAEEQVAGAAIFLPLAADWTYFEADVLDAFANAPAPESYVILASSTKQTDQPEMSTLWLDDLQFNGVSSANNLDLDASLNIYPNPVADHVRIEMQTSTMTKIVLTNSAGRQVLVNTLTDNQTEIDVSNLPSGIYVVSLSLTNGPTLHRSIQITH